LGKKSQGFIKLDLISIIKRMFCQIVLIFYYTQQEKLMVDLGIFLQLTSLQKKKEKKITKNQYCFL